MDIGYSVLISCSPIVGSFMEWIAILKIPFALKLFTHSMRTISVPLRDSSEITHFGPKSGFMAVPGPVTLKFSTPQSIFSPLL